MRWMLLVLIAAGCGDSMSVTVDGERTVCADDEIERGGVVSEADLPEPAIDWSARWACGDASVKLSYGEDEQAVSISTEAGGAVADGASVFQWGTSGKHEIDGVTVRWDVALLD